MIYGESDRVFGPTGVRPNGVARNIKTDIDIAWQFEIQDRDKIFN